jgi:hypothetical protein
MKLTLFLVFAVVVFSASVFMSADTDPFNARTEFHSITEMNPVTVYADSSLSVRNASTITWIGNSESVIATPISGIASNLTAATKDMQLLCDNPSEMMKNHPRFEAVCK